MLRGIGDEAGWGVYVNVDSVASISVEQDAANVRTVPELARLLRLLRRREARNRDGAALTYRELAARTGWSHAIIGEYLAGTALPPTDRFDQLIQILGATRSELGPLATARDRVEELRRPNRAAAAKAAARELARDRDIIAIVAGGGTEQTQAMQQPLAQAKIPTFTANEGKEFLAEIGEGKTYPWIFATSADPSLGVDPAIDAMVEQGVTKLGVLYPDYAYGQTMAALAEAAAKRLNIEVMVKSAAANAASYSAQLQELKAWGAQGLAISIFGAQAATAMSELQQIDWAPIVTGPLGIIDQAVIESMSPEVAQKAIASPVPQGFLGTGPLEGVVKGFYDHYSTIASTNVIDGRTFVGTYGFDAMLLINAALTANPKATGEDLKAWLDEGHEVTASRGTYSFGPQKRTNVLGDQYGIIVVGVPCGGGTKCAEYGG